MAAPGSGGVLVDFTRFTALRERHQVRRARMVKAPPPPPPIIEGVLVERAEPVTAGEPEVEPATDTVRLGRPWGGAGPHALPPRR